MSTNGPIKLEHFFEATRNTDLVTFHPALHQALAQHYEQPSHGRTTEWKDAFIETHQINQRPLKSLG